MAGIIETKKLELWYGEKQALHSIDIEIPDHQVTALIGPSGCGKSTFLKTLNRMNDLVPGVQHRGRWSAITAPDIFCHGTDVTWLRRQIGMVFQKPNPFPMSIYDNVAYGPRTHGIHEQERSWTTSWSSRCGTPPSGTRSRTG